MTSLLVLTPIRLALGVAGIGAAVAVGDARTAGLLAAFAVGAIITTVMLAADPRLLRNRQTLPLPPEARVMSPAATAAYGVMPSTVGVAALMAIALFFNGTLASLLAGIEAGMGITSFASWLRLETLERREGSRLYVQRGGARMFEAPR